MKMKKKNKKQMIISITAIVLIVVLILGATYAYFAAQYGDGASTNITVNTSTVDNLTFATGDEISFTATQSNFATGAGNLSGDTYASATLVANNETNSASANYYVQVYIGGNTFEYTTTDETAELLLVVTDPSGSTVTSLSGLNYTTVTDGKGETVSGFDITTYNGIITIADEYEITSTGTTTQEWTIEVIFVNLSTNQSSNAGASLTGSVYIGVDQVAYHEVCNDDSLSCTVAQLTTTSSSNLYYHSSIVDESGSTYDACYYNGEIVLSYANWGLTGITESTCSSVYEITDEDYIGYWDSTLMDSYTDSGEAVWTGSTCQTSSGDSVYTWWWWSNPTESQCTGTVYYSSNEGYYFIGIESVGTGEFISGLTLSAEDDSYRYSGSNSEVNNYVCFGSDEETCPSENLYRIIGVFQNDAGEYQIKLIMADYASSSLLGTDGDYRGYQSTSSYSSTYLGSQSNVYWYSWNYKNYSTAYNATGYYNVWSYSQLNTVNLNTNYWKTLESKWQDMVATTTWKVGGNGSNQLQYSNAKTAYTYEIENPNSNIEIEYSAKVGLMYLSDYYYAADSSYWGYSGYNYTLGESYDYRAATSSNWMYLGIYEWTISRSASNADGAFYVNNDGNVYYSDVNNFNAVRSVLYLESNTTYMSGDGTISSPYRIA